MQSKLNCAIAHGKFIENMEKLMNTKKNWDRSHSQGVNNSRRAIRFEDLGQDFKDVVLTALKGYMGPAICKNQVPTANF